MASYMQERLYSASKVFENVLRELLIRSSEEIVATDRTIPGAANQSAFSRVLSKQSAPDKIPAISDRKDMIFDQNNIIKLAPDIEGFDTTFLCGVLTGIKDYPTYRGKKDRTVKCVEPQCSRKCCPVCDHICIHGNQCKKCNNCKCKHCPMFRSDCTYNKILCCDSCKKCGFCNFQLPPDDRCVTYKLKANVDTIKKFRNVVCHKTEKTIEEFENGVVLFPEFPNIHDLESFCDMLRNNLKEVLSYLCDNTHFSNSNKNITPKESKKFDMDMHIALEGSISQLRERFPSEITNAPIMTKLCAIECSIEELLLKDKAEEKQSVTDDSSEPETSKDLNKMNGIKELTMNIGNVVSICKEVLVEQVEICSLKHEDANHNDPSIALANIFTANDHIVKNIPEIKQAHNKGIITDGNKINEKIDINEMGVALLCDVLGVIPDAMIEKPQYREKRIRQIKQKGLKCEASHHIKGCCQVCKHSCSKCYRANCKDKKCCLTKTKCNHVCVCCGFSVKDCTASSFVCCKQCNRCSNCQEVPKCKNLVLRQAVEKIKDYYTKTERYKKPNFSNLHDMVSLHDAVLHSMEIILNNICHVSKTHHSFREEKLEQIKLELSVTGMHIIGEANDTCSPISQERPEKVVDLLRKEYEQFEMFPLPWNKQNLLRLSDIYINTKCITSELGDKEFKPDLLEVLEIGNEKRIIVAAVGGMGKTTISKQLCLSWSRKERLRKYNKVIRLEIKDIRGDSCNDIYDAILRLLGRKVTDDERSRLEHSIETEKEKTLIVLDGLDEAPAHSKDAVSCFFGKEKMLPDSTVIVLSRPEAEGDIDFENTKCVNFVIEKLSRRQVTKFVSETYKFKSDTTSGRLLEDRKKLKVLNVMLAFPIYTVMLCGLYDDTNLRDPLEDAVDILLAVIALLIKTEKLKHLTSVTEKKKWNRKKSREIIHEYFHIISALGFAVYELNGKNFRNYEPLSESKVRECMISYLKDDAENVKNEIESALRWGFLDRYDLVSTSCETVMRFSHRHFRDLVSSFYLMTMSKDQLQKSDKPLLGLSEQIVIRYAIDVLYKLKYQTKEDYVDNLFNVWDECQEDSGIYLCYLLMSYISIPEASQRISSSIKRLLVSIMKLHKKGECCTNQSPRHLSHYISSVFSRVSLKGGEEVLSPDSVVLLDKYLKVLLDHSTQHSACKICKVPKKISNSFPKRNFFHVCPPDKDRKGSSVTFSEDKTYGVSQLLKFNHSKECFVLVLTLEDHVSRDSIYIQWSRDSAENIALFDLLGVKIERSKRIK